MSEHKITPTRMTKHILDAGANFTKDVIIEGYGIPIVVTVRPLTDDEMDIINTKTIKPVDAMEIVKATGRSLKELRGLTPGEWETLVSEAVTSGKIDQESFRAQTARNIELVKIGVVDEVIRNNPEKLRFGTLGYLGSVIENMSVTAPAELEDFLRQSMGSESQCSSPQGTNSQAET